MSIYAKSTFALVILLFLTAGHAMAQQHQHHTHGKPGAMAPTEPIPGAASAFSEEVEGLPEARPHEIVELKDGDRLKLTAAPVKQRLAGRWVRRLAYNGSVPGPILKVPQGARIHLRLKNDTDVDTTLHPHGLRIDDKNDGVPGVGQDPIKPGQSHDYVLTFPDAGMFWYHPHLREDYAQELGMYGGFLVTPRDAQHYNAVHREVLLVLDDALLKNPLPFYRDRATHTLMGRFGDVHLVNGVEDFALEAKEGEVLRLFLTNTANARVIRFAIPGQKLKLVGGDAGLYERETFVEAVDLAPSERAIVELLVPREGTYPIVNDKPTGRVPVANLLVKKGIIAPLKQPFEPLRSPPPAAHGLAEIKTKLGIPVAHTVRLTLSMDHKALPMDHDAHRMDRHSAPKKIEWDDDMPQMNARSDDRNVVWKLVDDATKKENMAIDWTFKKGDYVKIRIVNDARSMHPMQHPIHFHGQRFVVAAVDGRPNDNLVWKDSALVGAGETMDVVLEASQVGRWMAHCHISEHLSAGMMLGFKVVE